LAGWIWLKEKGELNPQLVELCKRAIDTASINVVGRAQAIIKNYSDLVPKDTGTALRWPALWTE